MGSRSRGKGWPRARCRHRTRRTTSGAPRRGGTRSGSALSPRYSSRLCAVITHRRWHWIAVLAVFVAVSIAAIATGAVRIPVGDVIRAIGGEGDESVIAIVRSLRLPRVALAALIGAGLGMSGGALQGTLRNGLAEPYLLGVSGGAAVGAVAAFSAGANDAGWIGLAAFIGAAGAVVLALLVARAAGAAGRGDPRTLL